MRFFILAAVALVLCSMAATFALAQSITVEEKQALVARREATERELESLAIIDHKVMVPMRDGKRMAADIYRLKDETKKYPIVFFRTPYNINYWDVKLGTYADVSRQLDFVKHGYATIEMTERGHFFSEGTWDILGAPLTDADDEFNWMSALPWTNGKVGLIGCSSSAEWRLGAASLGNKALATIVPRGFGAGVGKVGPYNEQGTWYRGGAMQLWFIVWLYSDQNMIRPMFPSENTPAELTAVARMFDLAPQMPPIDWAKALQHLPVDDIMNAVRGPHGIFADKVSNTTGGAMIQRTPSDPAWRKGGLWQSDTMPINMHPTPSYGGNICCGGNSIPGESGSLDQRKIEERPEILVYTSPPLAREVEVSGPVTVTLYVSSDVKDTDVTAKLIDVLPDGTAYNLDETIQRLRYRDGDDHSVWLEKGKVCKVTLTPLTMSVLFGVGHRIRLEVAGSNFPRFERNLNTGGNNYDETESIVAHTAIHHSALYPSAIQFTVVPKSSPLATK